MSLFDWLNPFTALEKINEAGSKVDSFIPTSVLGTFNNVIGLAMGGVRKLWDGAVDFVTGIGKKKPQEQAPEPPQGRAHAEVSHGHGHGRGYTEVHYPNGHGDPYFAGHGLPEDVNKPAGRRGK